MIMDKTNIVIIGRKNTGKSSLINAIVGQTKAIVSAVAGTTTDPVKKSYELPNVASIVFVDTAGIDDLGELGELRIKKTGEAIQQADAAILVITDNLLGQYEEDLIQKLEVLKTPYMILHNKSDKHPPTLLFQQRIQEQYEKEMIAFSTFNGENAKLIEAITKLIGKPQQHSLLEGIIKPKQLVLLVTPIDSAAPTGRLILPQVQMLRELLDHHCISIVLQTEELAYFFTNSPLHPDLVITDSQVFAQVASLIPSSIPLTSFSVILAHHKGNFSKYLEGTPKIESLQDGDRILILESCSHHVSCEDIGRVKIPHLLKKYTRKQLEFDFIAGLDSIQRPFTDYSLIIQCGGCMITAHQLRNRLKPAIDAGVPVSNYGLTIAYVQQLFERVVQPFL